MSHDVLQGYLESVTEQIHSLEPIYTEKYEEEILTPNRCNLRIRVRFPNNFLLEMNEAIIIEDNQVKHLNYRYHFQDEANELIF